MFPLGLLDLLDPHSNSNLDPDLPMLSLFSAHSIHENKIRISFVIRPNERTATGKKVNEGHKSSQDSDGRLERGKREVSNLGKERWKQVKSELNYRMQASQEVNTRRKMSVGVPGVGWVYRSELGSKEKEKTNK